MFPVSVSRFPGGRICQSRGDVPLSKDAMERSGFPDEDEWAGSLAEPETGLFPDRVGPSPLRVFRGVGGIGSLNCSQRASSLSGYASIHPRCVGKPC